MRPAPASLAGVALAAMLAAGSPRAAPPPEFPFADGLPKPTLPARPATVLRLGDFAVEFERTSMLQVLRSVGAGEIHSQGDAGDSLAWICYFILGKSGVQLLWITSGELQGGQIADGVVASAATAAPAAGDCAALPERFQPVRVDGGLWLGSARADLDKAFPAPSAERSGWLEYVHEERFKDSYRDSERGNTLNTVEYDEASSLALRLLDGHVAELHAGKTTTY